jgi:hypothetical protein
VSTRRQPPRRVTRRAPDAAQVTARPTPRTQTPARVAYVQVTDDDADARIAQALKLLARAGAFDA